MGLYVNVHELPVKYVRGYSLPMKAWLDETAKPFYPNQKKESTQTLVYWQRTPWGENAAIAFSAEENRRLNNSGVFELVYAADTKTLKQYARF